MSPPKFAPDFAPGFSPRSDVAVIIACDARYLPYAAVPALQLAAQPARAQPGTQERLRPPVRAGGVEVAHAAVVRGVEHGVGGALHPAEARVGDVVAVPQVDVAGPSERGEAEPDDAHAVSPRRCAFCTASARLRTESLRYSDDVCSLTVCGERNSWAAISGLDSPRATARVISCSRTVRR